MPGSGRHGSYSGAVWGLGAPRNGFEELLRVVYFAHHCFVIQTIRNYLEFERSSERFEELLRVVCYSPSLFCHSDYLKLNCLFFIFLPFQQTNIFWLTKTKTIAVFLLLCFRLLNV